MEILQELDGNVVNFQINEPNELDAPVTDDAEASDSASTRKLESREEAGEPEFDSRRGNKPEDEKQVGSYVEEQVGGETLELACLTCSRISFENVFISTNNCTNDF